MFKFPKALFTKHGLTYVDKDSDQLEDNEACWHKETQHPNGSWLHYRMTIKRDGHVSSLVIRRDEFLQWVADGKGDEYMAEVLRRVTNAS